MSSKHVKRSFKQLFYDPWFDLMNTEDKREYYIDGLIGEYSNVRYYIEKMYDAKQWSIMYEQLERCRGLDEELERKVLLARKFNSQFESNEEAGFLEALEEIEGSFREAHLTVETSYIDAPKVLVGWRTILQNTFRESY